METLFITLALVLALFPKLLFSIGFWLSVAGVFYIFLFFIYFSKLGKVKQFFLLPVWVYLMMLPYSLAIFGNFTLYHPLSIVASILFSIFYPLALLLHFLGFGDLLDTPLRLLLNAAPHTLHTKLPLGFFSLGLLLSLGAVFSRRVLYLLLVYTLAVFIYFIYKVA
jgi:competence protein ComEC